MIRFVNLFTDFRFLTTISGHAKIQRIWQLAISFWYVLRGMGFLYLANLLADFRVDFSTNWPTFGFANLSSFLCRDSMNLTNSQYRFDIFWVERVFLSFPLILTTVSFHGRIHWIRPALNIVKLMYFEQNGSSSFSGFANVAGFSV